MKIIDLLNKIANGEEVPKKIKYNRETFIFNDNLKRYVEISNKDSDSSTYCLGGFFALDMSLNEKVEIIEEKPKRIEEYKQNINLASSTNQEQAVKIFKYLCDFADKINELTKATNYLLEKSDSE